MKGLNYRLMRNRHAHVFSRLNLNDFTTCHTGTGRCCEKVCLAFPLVHISFPKNLVYAAHAEF